ncbi:ABC transporter permease [Corynebacterium uropygiale]|uniref:ABC transporter permease n=1 Tax=Corynebacterium uropygiale TaxID=1775911 RepID=A0A9X1QRV5_9CORY|nr:ABC transporter permease [Corynebacterium uropygiale]MCF4007247.1 ABC transporter permease [Corynebacterium uropygiale]
MLRLIQAEWIKLSTTASLWWTSALTLVFGIGMGALMGAFGGMFDGLTLEMPTELLVSGIYPFAMVVLAIQAVMVVTTEYRYHIPSVLYSAEPKRWRVALAKLILYLVIAVLLTLVTVVLTIIVAQIAAGRVDFSVFTQDDTRRVLWAYPVTAALIVIFSQGVGLLIRQTAGSVSLTLVWMLLLEDVAGMLPKVGTYISEWGPFSHLSAFILNNDSAELGVPFGAAAWYFLAWAAVLWIAGVVVLEKRDA